MFLAGIETDFEHLLHPEIKKSIQNKLEEHYISVTFSEKEKAQIPSGEALEDASKPERLLFKLIRNKASSHRIHRHWNFSDLNLSNKPYIIGAISYLSTLILSVFFMLLLAFFHQPLNFLFVGVMFSTTSVGIVFPILYELKFSVTDYGQSILIVSIIADFISMILITVLSAVYASGIAIDLLLIPLIFLIFISCFQIMKILKKHPKWYSKFTIRETSTTDVKVTASIFLLLTFIILSELFGIEMILGAFIAGILFSLITPHQKAKELHEKLHAIGYGFTIPIFFIMVGAQMRIEELFLNWSSVIIGLTLLGIAFFIKILPNFLLYRKRFGTKKSIASGLLQSSRLSLIIASASIGYFLGLISKTIFEATILIAIITSTISPIIFTYFMKEKKATNEIGKA